MFKGLHHPSQSDKKIKNKNFFQSLLVEVVTRCILILNWAIVSHYQWNIRVHVNKAIDILNSIKLSQYFSIIKLKFEKDCYHILIQIWPYLAWCA